MYAKVLRSACSLLLLFCGLTACKKDHKDESEVAAKNDWLISGRFASDEYEQILALSTTGERYESSIREDNSFTLTLPATESFAVYFLPLLNSKKDASATIIDKSDATLLSFNGDSETGMTDILRLPKNSSYKTLDLGTITIKGEYAYPSTNPANKLDFDNDGIPDLQDHDDDNDGNKDTAKNVLSERISVCHEQEKTMAIAFLELLMHLEHDDTMGACDPHEHEERIEHAQRMDKNPKHPHSPTEEANVTAHEEEMN